MSLRKKRIRPFSPEPKRKRRFSRLAVVLSGLLCGALYAFPAAGLLCWIAMVPYAFVLLEDLRQDRRPAFFFLRGLEFSFFYVAAGFSWILSHTSGQLLGYSVLKSLIYSVLALLGLSLVYGLLYAFVPLIFSAAAGLKRLKYGGLLLSFLFAFLWILAEWAMTKTWAGVPWTRLAVTQYKFPIIIQTASALGSYFISFLMVSVNFLTAYGIWIFISSRDRKRMLKCLAAAVMIFALNLGAGCIMFGFDRAKDTGEAVTAAALQGNTDVVEKWKSAYYRTAAGIYSSMAKEAAGNGARLIVMPETSINVYINNYKEGVEKISKTAKKYDCVIAVGCFDEFKGRIANTIVLIGPDGKLQQQRYYKRLLVPFGEFLPWRGFFEKTIPVLAEINRQDGDLSTGETASVTDTAYGRVGFMICFESIYESLAADTAADGAELIIMSTNDSWFSGTAALSEHLGHTVLRAVENRRYIVCAAESGISAVISAQGEVRGQSRTQTKEIVYGQVIPRKELSFYTRYPWLMTGIALCYTVFCLCFSVGIRIKTRKQLG